MQARQGQWGTVGRALWERVWVETQEGRKGGRRGAPGREQAALMGLGLRAVHASGQEGGEGRSASGCLQGGQSC